ncbi:endonuclease/exonuclease/phosphatase family protein [Mycolicibacterium sp. D5.8-2]|uniref:endonuclease/exonuclease/phosphatase family protein n=1 Tax=Mycolicibacterium sp. D5.8-2 TaxID=3085903 RepID=UPI00298C5858|nr:endonuclease/exonuclease/phosphatase family protein [Mycolicibacterium sp. D5.8-2]MDW5611088.1 endonuclease/exonuclease/phosphatase family protein [Mycolicibacterium sp. D5.8-2]
MSRVALISPLESLSAAVATWSTLVACGELRGQRRGRARLILSGRHRVRNRGFHAVLAAVALAFTVATLVIRALPLPNNLALVIAVGAPYVVLVALLGLVVAALSRLVVLSIVAVVVVAASLAVQVHWYHGGRSGDVAAERVDVRVMSSNLRYGRADTEEFVELARGSADVITVTELTSEAVQRFYSAGIDEEFPHSMLFPAPNAGGNGIWSRYPLTPLSPTRYWNSGMVAARVQIPGVPIAPAVASVHITSPMGSFESWRNGVTATKSRLVGLAEAVGQGAVIAAGDFNSTPDMRQFRDLLVDGYHDAVRHTGAGLMPTFPSDTILPPVITIDHVLTRQANVTSIRSVDVGGSDHRALLATVDVPIASSGS